ncbi:DUF928 domain-containing protein [Iningainema tapete]|uniref:DUF928 domain-containing protein n=1 Tax=Iningainema tapete BLCC-T55 TaxID=2748662 RepID=A0A8J7BXP1_9CYAN|nr:DUF928 domain-containing protein [Iningainema tapete]MBD2774107.1 DUF928 domain-containing protein [Iningainema tapete BLCC-T55]
MVINDIAKNLTIYVSVGFLLSVSIPAQAQSELKTKSASQQPIFQENFKPPGRKKPKDTTGAGSRDGISCSQQQGSIRPLMPKGNYGLTLQERPTIFVKMPKTSTSKQVVLMFRDEAGKYYQRAFLPIAQKNEIVSFTLPDAKPPLEVGKNYQWSLAVICGENLQPDDPVFSGWVQRVARTPQLDSELRQKTMLEQALWYGARGYWYDLLQAIVELRRSHPNDPKLIAMWQDVLKSVGLDRQTSETIN